MKYENKTNTYQSFRVGTHDVNLAPKGEVGSSLELSPTEVKDDVIQYLLSIGAIQEVKKIAKKVKDEAEKVDGEVVSEVKKVEDELSAEEKEVLSAAAPTEVKIGADVPKSMAEQTKPEIPVAKFETEKGQKEIAVTCAATLKNGKQCTVAIPVPVGEFDATKPYFCGRHKGEKAEDYERVNGEWHKKA